MKTEEIRELCGDLVKDALIKVLDAKTEEEKKCYRKMYVFFSQLKQMTEKNIKRKPIGDLHSVPHYRCPNCNRTVVLYESDTKNAHCHWCGQALDWRSNK